MTAAGAGCTAVAMTCRTHFVSSGLRRVTSFTVAVATTGCVQKEISFSKPKFKAEARGRGRQEGGKKANGHVLELRRTDAGNERHL